jgi:predicted phosphodiesterase
MSAKSIAGETAVQYIRKFPNYPNKTLARMLVDREPVLFQDVERTRLMIRTYRGNNGKAAAYMIQPGCKKPNGTQLDSLELLPDPIEEPTKWHVHPVSFKRALVISDLHIPFHDKSSVMTALEHGKRLGCDHVIINGDLMDFYSISYFERDPRVTHMCEELETGKRFLEVLRDYFPKAQITYVEGNHEERLWRFCYSRLPELFGTLGPDGKQLISLEGLMDCAEYGVKVVSGRQPLLAGDHLYILHGHEFRQQFSSPVNPARGLYLRTKANALCGHNHQTSQHSETGLENIISCWSTGCLCHMHPQYSPLNKWTTGFATIELSGPEWSVQNHKIINGSVV